MQAGSVDPGVLIPAAVFLGLTGLWVGLILHHRRARTRRVAERAHAAFVRGWTSDVAVKERLAGSGTLFRFRGRTPRGVPWVLETERHYERTGNNRKRAWGLTAWSIGKPGPGDPALLLLPRETYESLREAQGGLGGAVAAALVDSRLKRLGKHDSTLAAMLSRRRAVLQIPELQKGCVALVAGQADPERLVTLEVERALFRLLTNTGAPERGEIGFVCVYVARGTLRVVVAEPIDVDNPPALEALVDLGGVLAETPAVRESW